MIQASIRVAESLAELNVLREDIATWQDYWENSEAVQAHRTQLTLLTDVLHAVITDIEQWARNEFDLAADAGPAYAACGKADKLTLTARRLWRWYADKIDHLSDEPTSPEERTVRAADELIWSCWKTAWTHLRPGEPPPSAPIPYLEAEFAASATPREKVPQGIRPGDADEPLKKHISLLPIPVIALPSACARRPWWLIVAAHETGHLVQDQLTLVPDTVRDLERNSGDDADLWGTWGRELFADAFSVLLAGPAAIWAIAELEMRADLNQLCAGSAYPPPLVRVEVANEVARQAGIADYDPGFPPMPHDDQIAQLVAHAPAVATALLGLLGGSGHEPNGLGTQTADAFSEPGGSIAIWRDNLLSNEDTAHRTQPACRPILCLRFYVAAWLGIARDVAARQRLGGTDLGEPELLAEARPARPGGYFWPFPTAANPATPRCAGREGRRGRNQRFSGKANLRGHNSNDEGEYR